MLKTNKMLRTFKKKVLEFGIKVLGEHRIIDTLLPNNFYFSHQGYCPCCDKEVLFKATHSWLRDYFLCTNCGSIPRERALMLVIDKYYPNWHTLHIHESSPSNRGVSLKLTNKAANYTASQYYPHHPFGTLINGFQNQDLEQQTFADASFDLVITQDVMEHTYNPEKAFAEIARTLKKGGAHIFTVPIINKFQPTEIWATKGQDSNPIFLKNPEWHGNPVDAKGSPVTMHWGFDITNFIKEKSGLDTTIIYIDDLYFGIRAEFIEVLVSTKKS